MIVMKRTDSGDQDFRDLVTLLDADLAMRDGDKHPFYAQFNKIESIKHAVVAYDDVLPVGCGAIKDFEPGTMEVKRMYVLPEYRNKGVGARVLFELEQWAKELSCSKCILETGKKQPEAIALYTKRGYSVVPNYGQYAGVDDSVCFAKKIE
jgi:putative acetyltransferase